MYYNMNMLIKRAILALMIFDNWVTQGFKKVIPSRYKKEGQCRKCGACCREIHLRMTKKQIRNDFFRDLAVRWISWLYGFVLLKIDYSRCYLVFTCRHKDPGGLCGNYNWRPPICRNFPLVDYFEKPVFIKNCGYQTEIR